ncbi:hypothetical protein SNE40_021284 [Patella caerulea]|uniref:HAT C-terminal dimerisation domain-containing protein n=1 Tax=Patella caerulea TaxID=87958 RepID=A0AAN8G420_PATCE
MIERFLEQEKTIKLVLSSDRKSVFLLPKVQDLEVLEVVNKAINLIVEFTDALSGESHVNVSMVMPVIQLLNDDILAHKEEDVTLTREIKTRILDYLNDKYSDERSKSLLNIASFLDPRYKTKFLTASDNISTQMKVREEAISVTSLNSDNTYPTTSDSNIETDTSFTLPPQPAKKLRLGNLFKRRDSLHDTDISLTDAEVIDNELKRYLALPNTDYESNPLEWWKENYSFFPKLSPLVRKYLCIPATSCPSERLFSTSGNIVSCKRTCLNPDKVNQLVFLARNLRMD